MCKELIRSVLESPEYIKAREEYIEKLAANKWGYCSKEHGWRLAVIHVSRTEFIVEDALKILLTGGCRQVRWEDPKGLQRFVGALFHYVALENKHPPPYMDYRHVYYALKEYYRCLDVHMCLQYPEYMEPYNLLEVLKATVEYTLAKSRLNGAISRL